MLRKPLLLAIDALGLDVWHMHDHRLVRGARFAVGEHAALAAWLAGRSVAETCRIVVNLADEAYEIEDLPRLRGGDRKALLARRSAAWFPPPAFARNWSLGAPPDGRAGAERIVFAGLERTDALLPWLEVVRTSRLRVTRLVSAGSLLPLILALPATGGAPLRGPQLVAGFTRGGLRISLIEDGRLHFSRLVEHCTLATARQSPAWRDEIERTRAYLLAQHRLASGSVAPILVLERAEAVHTLTPAPAPAENGRPGVTFAGTATAGSTSGGPSDADETPSVFETQLLHALLRAPGKIGWSLDAAGAGMPLHERLRPSPRALALACVVVAGTVGAGVWLSEREAAAAARATEAAARSAREEAARIAAQAPTQAPAPPTAPIEAPVLAPPPPEETAPPITPPPCAPAVAPPPSPLPTPQRIDGILLRPDGEALVWLDGTLGTARAAGLHRPRGQAPALSARHDGRRTLRTGDTWTPPAAATAPSSLPATGRAPPPGPTTPLSEAAERSTAEAGG